MWIHTPYQADYILAVGDRIEVFEHVLRDFKQGRKIIHLWAGEADLSVGTLDEFYRPIITLLSCMQLCTNPEAKARVEQLFKGTSLKPDAHVVGNVMLDNFEIDESEVPDVPYNLVLYNPPTLLASDEIINEINYTDDISSDIDRIWIEPNGDTGSDLLKQYVTHKNLPRPKFLGLLKNCERYITNSSSAYYEARFLIKKEQIVMVGKRNKKRDSKDEMDIPNATDNIIKIFKEAL